MFDLRSLAIGNEIMMEEALWINKTERCNG